MMNSKVSVGIGIRDLNKLLKKMVLLDSVPGSWFAGFLQY